MNDPAASPPLETDCAWVARMLNEGADLFLLDCREQAEHDMARVAAATLLPMSELAQRAAELEPHRERRVIVMCHLGGRSLQVAQWLRQQGFGQAQSMAGGIDQWSVEIDPTVPRY